MDTIAAGWTAKLARRYGTFLVLAVDRGDPLALCDPGPVLTVRMLGRPDAPEFDVSLGMVDFRSARSPGGECPWAHMAMFGQFTEPVPERAA